MLRIYFQREYRLRRELQRFHIMLLRRTNELPQQAVRLHDALEDVEQLLKSESIIRYLRAQPRRLATLYRLRSSVHNTLQLAQAMGLVRRLQRPKARVDVL